MSHQLERFLILSGLTALLAACEPNVVIGAKWSLTEGGQGPASGQVGGGGGSSGSTDAAPAGAASEADGGASGAGGASTEEWCAVAPWSDAPAVFSGANGVVIPAGSYSLQYVSGAQIHDVDIGYEVTGHYYGKNMLAAGHHLFNGDCPEGSATHVWLGDEGLVAGGSLAAVEAANRGHTWPIELAGGPLRITLYDDDYHDNSGPGSKFCLVPAMP